ncbi:MAG: flagellar export chaperone FlgN [Candidatus Binatia bacterium]
MEQVERLEAVLGDEIRVCDALAGVLRDEREAVVRLRPEAILACLAERQALQDELVRLAEARRGVVRAVADRHGRATERAIEVLPLLPPEPQARVRGLVRRLRAALLVARSLERQNAQLAGGSLDHVTELLRALRGLVPGARYGADAAVAVPSGAERVDQRV